RDNTATKKNRPLAQTEKGARGNPTKPRTHKSPPQRLRCPITRPETVTPSALHRDDNLPEMPVGIHDIQRFRNLRERKNLVDRQVELAGLHGRPQIGVHQPVDLADLLKRSRAEGDADV